MVAKTDRIKWIVIKHLDKGLTETEQRELNEWMEASAFNHDSVSEFVDEAKLMNGIRDLYQARKRIWQRLDEQIQQDKIVPMYRRPLFRWFAAASIMGIMIVSAYLVFDRRDPTVTPDNPTAAIGDVKAPGISKAMITLSDGRQVSLDSLASLSDQSITITKSENGEIIYSGKGNSTAYNTLSNPRGSQPISVTLSDGTKVWLNAESSLTYPLAFTTTERAVEIDGEAYFEVARDKTKKFLVRAGDVITEVLGTHFNVNNYKDEATTNVTLLEGSVKVSKADISQLLKPGQQAQIAGDIRLIKNADLDAVMAWKNGLFNFNGADIQTIMRQIGRWYDIEVVYVGSVPTRIFEGKVQRNLNLSQVLKLLEQNRIHFTIEGNKLTVRP